MLAARSPDSRSRSTWVGCIRSLEHGADEINLSASSVPSCLLKHVPLDDDDNKNPAWLLEASKASWSLSYSTFTIT